MLASFHKYETFVQKLIKFSKEFGVGIDLSKRDIFGNDALMWACIGGDENIVKLLLSKGSDIDIVDKFGNTTLINAIKNSNIAVARLLIDKNADITVTTKSGNTPLQLAKQKNLNTIVDILERKGARK
jgi:ankyrin repeat protein